MNCIVCKRELENVVEEDDSNQPNDGLAFQSHGHYGTTVFDPMDGTFLEINVCDPCLRQAGKDGNVMIGFPKPSTRGPMMPWPLVKVEAES
jgi:hypothetical protein